LWHRISGGGGKHWSLLKVWNFQGSERSGWISASGSDDESGNIWNQVQRFMIIHLSSKLFFLFKFKVINNKHLEAVNDD